MPRPASRRRPAVALTALAAAVNMVGNVAAGRLLQRGVAPLAPAAAAASRRWPWRTVAFAGCGEAAAAGAAIRGGAAVSRCVGGLIPATLFVLAVRLAPSAARCRPRSAGCSSGPRSASSPARRWWPGWPAPAGGWQWTWVVTGACSPSRAWAWRAPCRGCSVNAGSRDSLESSASSSGIGALVSFLNQLKDAGAAPPARTHCAGSSSCDFDRTLRRTEKPA